MAPMMSHGAPPEPPELHPVRKITNAKKINRIAGPPEISFGDGRLPLEDSLAKFCRYAYEKGEH